MKTSLRARIGKIRLPSSLIPSFSSLSKLSHALECLEWHLKGFPSLSVSWSDKRSRYLVNVWKHISLEWNQSNLYSGYCSCWSLSSTGDWLIFFWSPINVIRNRFLRDNWLHISNSLRGYRKNHLKLPVTMLWIASFTLKEKCLGRQRWPSLLSISRVNKSTPIYNADLVGSVLIPITGLPLLRILLAPIKNVPSPPVVTTMSAHLNFRWSK